MLGYVKSIVAVILAAASVAGAGFWFARQSATVATLETSGRVLRARTKKEQQQEAMIKATELQLTRARNDVRTIAARLAEEDQGGPELLRMIVETASESGLQMTGASESKPTEPQESRGTVAIRTISYRVGLKGTYAALVKFFQKLNSWELYAIVDSLDASRHSDYASTHELDIDMTLSIYSASEKSLLGTNK